jgi:hypothetical protein
MVGRSDKMGKWVRLSKKHPEITDDNEVCNVHELGGPQGNQIVQGQHFYQAGGEPEAQELATFFRTESAIVLSEAERLFKENIATRLRDGYVHVQYLNFRLGRLVYVGRWDEGSKQFVRDVFRVVQIKDRQEMNRFTDLAQACALWVKHPSERRIESLRVGTEDVLGEITPGECCGVLRRWLTENKLLRDDERKDMTQLVDEAEALAHQRRLTTFS